MVARAEAAEARLATLRQESPEVQEGSPAAASVAGAPSIEFRGLTFAYPGSARPVLRGVDLVIPAGSSLGVVGPTASGKTTLAMLLARIHEPPSGAILLDGVDVRGLELGGLRRALAFVPQESFVFSDTIGANVAFGVDAPAAGRIADVVRQAGLDEDLAAFPDGLATRVGERGVTLSGGQRQRVALARALLLDAPVLVLDDALSAVDTGTERMILRNLAPVLRGRTSIVISHRLSAVAGLDRIVVLEHGSIVEAGDHAELLLAQGAYARLWAMQQDERELERL